MSGHKDKRRNSHDDEHRTERVESRRGPHGETDHVDGHDDHDRDGHDVETSLRFLPTEADVLARMQGRGLVSGTDGADALAGGISDARLWGGAGNDTLVGGRGEDTLLGGAGDDALFGGRDEDWLMGGTGNDVLDGGAGRDLLFGGAGADRFDLRFGGGHDRVIDFNIAEGDRIGLAAGTAYTVTTGADGFAVVCSGTNDWFSLTGVQASQVDAGWFVVT